MIFMLKYLFTIFNNLYKFLNTVAVRTSHCLCLLLYSEIASLPQMSQMSQMSQQIAMIVDSKRLASCASVQGRISSMALFIKNQWE